MLANSPILTYLSAFYAQISQFNAFFSALFRRSPHYTLLHDLQNKAPDSLHYPSQSSLAIVIYRRFF